MFAPLILIAFCIFTGQSSSTSLKEENARLLRANKALLKGLASLNSEVAVGETAVAGVKMVWDSVRENECGWDGVDSKNQYSLGGGGHTDDECTSACENRASCNFASISSGGYCHLTETCNGRSSDNDWWVYQKPRFDITCTSYSKGQCSDRNKDKPWYRIWDVTKDECYKACAEEASIRGAGCCQYGPADSWNMNGEKQCWFAFEDKKAKISSSGPNFYEKVVRVRECSIRSEEKAVADDLPDFDKLRCYKRCRHFGGSPSKCEEDCDDATEALTAESQEKAVADDLPDFDKLRCYKRCRHFGGSPSKCEEDCDDATEIEVAGDNTVTTYITYSGGKCQTTDHADPKYGWHANVPNCNQICTDSADCYGYSNSDQGHCLTWKQSDIMGGGDEWGNADCHIKHQRECLTEAPYAYCRMDTLVTYEHTSTDHLGCMNFVKQEEECSMGACNAGKCDESTGGIIACNSIIGETWACIECAGNKDKPCTAKARYGSSELATSTCNAEFGCGSK